LQVAIGTDADVLRIPPALRLQALQPMSEQHLIFVELQSLVCPAHALALAASQNYA
jgi:hypothetical protein